MNDADPLRRAPIEPDWWRKSFAGAVLGLSLAVALAGLFAWCGPGGIDAPQKTQFVMWMIAPVWMAIFGAVFLVRSGARALVWLALANIAAYGALVAVRSAAGAW